MSCRLASGRPRSVVTPGFLRSSARNRADTAMESQGGHMLRIVIAEQDEALSRWLADAIAPAQGFEVVGTALDGESAIDVVRRTRPDVVLVDADIVMPRQGGLSLVAAIKDTMPETMVVVLAADALDETAEAALAAGATGVLAKDGSAQIPADLGWPDLAKEPGPSASHTKTASQRSGR
jgi:CheY-like chemotaxis protein